MSVFNQIRDQIKSQYRFGGPHIRLIVWMVGIWFGLQIIELLFYFISKEMRYDFLLFQYDFLVADANWETMKYKPWTIVTYMFMHGGFMHLLGNMVMLHLGGRFLNDFLGKRRFYFVFFFTGIMAFLVHVLMHHVTDGHEYYNGAIVGASGAITGILVAVVTLSPRIEINLFGAFRVLLIILVGLYILLDILALDDRDGTAHWAHLGGALFGYLYVKAYQKGTDISQWFQFNWVRNLFKRKSKIRVAHSNVRSTAEKQKDDQYNASKADRQAKVDAILDKIKDSGYDSLSKAEKAFLFEESKKL